MIEARKTYLGIGVALSVALASSAANAAVTTYALPGQAGILKSVANDTTAWTNSYGRMTHPSQITTNELDFPILAVEGATGLSASINVDVSPPYHTVFVTLPQKICAQILAMDLTGNSVMVTAVQCEVGPDPNGVTGYTLPLGSLVPLPSFYSFIAVWATGTSTINSVSYAITK